MTTAPLSATTALEDGFGRQLAQRLTAGSLDLPHDLGERLRAARMQAVASRKLAPLALRAAPAVMASGDAAVLGGGWWTRLGAAVSLAALVVGVFAISTVQDNQRAREAADVDAALLTDDLPPAAFTDPGFAQFLKSVGPTGATAR